MAFYQVQGQDYSLAGSGCGITDTSITLSSMTYPNGGANVVTADLGVIGYATIEPASSREENISFTGITQNADGTATLTGVVRGLQPKTPYTADNSLRTSHAGGALIRLTNSAPYYTEFGIKKNDETVPGKWDFTVSPTVPAVPVYATDAVPKVYVDGLVASGVPDCYVTKDGSDPTLYINIGSGYVKVNSDVLFFTGSSAVAMTPSATNYVQLDSRGNLAVNTSAFEVGCISLAKVTTNGTTITSIEDARPFFSSNITSQVSYQYFQFGETLGFGDPFYIKQSDGKAYKANSTDAAHAEGFMGVVIEPGTNDGSYHQGLTDGMWGYASGLTANAEVYLTDAGGFSSSAGTYKKVVGWAKSAVEFELRVVGRIEDIEGGNSSLTTTNVNNLATFQQNVSVNWTYTNADTLVAGATSDAKALHKHKTSSAVATYDLSTATGTQTIAHGLGQTPNFVKITVMGPFTGSLASVGTYDGTNNQCIYISNPHSTNASSNTTYAALVSDTSTGASQSATVTVDATNVTLHWTKTSTPTGTAAILIEVM